MKKTRCCLKFIKCQRWTVFHVGVIPLSSWTPRAAQNNLLLVSCITKMGHFLIFFSWVDIHGIYYIVKNGNQNWGSIFLIKHIVSNYNDAKLN